MAEIRVRKKITLEEIMAENPTMIFYAVNSCWWTHRSSDLGSRAGSGLPCCPRGSVLMQSDMPTDFLELAKAGAAHYGKHGIEAFLAAHNDNCMHPFEDRPWSASGWDAYNDALDALEAP